jgi:hypothetical protein
VMNRSWLKRAGSRAAYATDVQLSMSHARTLPYHASLFMRRCCMLLITSSDSALYFPLTCRSLLAHCSPTSHSLLTHFSLTSHSLCALTSHSLAAHCSLTAHSLLTHFAHSLWSLSY